jgi:hypothetical protein
MPTLVYNCAKLPATCTKINRGSGSSLERLPGGGLGKLINGLLTLHLDTDKARKKARRNLACPDNWRESHDCPETNPPQPNTTSLEEGSYPARPYMPARQGKQRGDKGWNTIADNNGQAAGLVSWDSPSAYMGLNAYTSCTFYSLTWKNHALMFNRRFGRAVNGHWRSKFCKHDLHSQH